MKNDKDVKLYLAYLDLYIIKKAIAFAIAFLFNFSEDYSFFLHILSPRKK